MSVRVLVGNSLEVLPTLEKNSVHCSVTSPPYYGLRKYQGDQQCDWPEVEYSPMPGLPPIAVEPTTCALGHEPTIEAYVGHLVAIYREVWRVLRDDGVAWIVMGDSYSGGDGYYPNAPSNQVGSLQAKGNARGIRNIKGARNVTGLQQGDLMLVPHRLALALQADRWLVRNDDVWAKVAPMPESVSGWRWERHRVKVGGAPAGTRNVDNRNRQGDPAHSGGYRSDVANNPTARWIDCPGCPKCEPNGGYVLKRGSWRHTRAHEFVFMLAKGMQYWTNQEAVREALAEASIERMNQPTFHEQTGGAKDYGSGSNRSARKALENLEQSRNGRNPRSVLSPPPEPFPGPHFAVFPTGLVEPLIKATCPDKCCPECGAGWSPVVETIRVKHPHTPGKGGRQTVPGMETSPSSCFRTGLIPISNILGYRPTCGCHAKGVDLLPDDLEVINTPIGTRVTEDPLMETGRAGFNRPRGPNEGTRPITRYEQRCYADQLKNSIYRDRMETEAGSAFAHYIRTDKSGARPAPEHLLEGWIERGWIDRVFLPEFNSDPPHVPGVCLDPFFGAGTVGLVCDRLGLDCIGIDISESYAVDIARERIVADAPLFADVAVREGI